MAISTQLASVRGIVETVCANELMDNPSTPLTVVGEGDQSALRWVSPRIPVGGASSDLDPIFEVDFQVVRAPMLQVDLEFLVVTLYLVGGDPAVLPREGGRLGGRRLLELNALNREEPGVKFRFQEPASQDDGSWIVIEGDVRLDLATERTIGDLLTRLLDCAEARFMDVYEWCVLPD